MLPVQGSQGVHSGAFALLATRCLVRHCMHVLSLPDFSLALLAKLSADLTPPQPIYIEVILSGFMPSALCFAANTSRFTYLFVHSEGNALIGCSNRWCHVHCPRSRVDIIARAAIRKTLAIDSPAQFKKLSDPSNNVLEYSSLSTIGLSYLSASLFFFQAACPASDIWGLLAFCGLVGVECMASFSTPQTLQHLPAS